MVTDAKIDAIINQIKKYQNEFIIGTAASAHQVEGDNINDWSQFEKIEGNIANNEKSGKACNHYNLYDLDFQLLEELGFKAHRLSIEWSRIYPKENQINYDELDHYKKVLKSLKNHHQISFVTLHHFTSPIWFMEKNGFLDRNNLHYWEEFVDLITRELGDLIDVFNTINEPYVYAANGYFLGVNPPGQKSIFKFMKVGNNLMRAHFIAVDLIRKNCPNKKVGIVKNLIIMKPYHKWNPIDLIIYKIFNWGYNNAPLNGLKRQRIPFGLNSIKSGDLGDFIGINYYEKLVIGIGLPDLMVPHEPKDKVLTQMGWGIYPEGFTKVLMKGSKLGLPIFITENGIATDDDEVRKNFILDHLSKMIEAMELGVDIKGYFYWSNIDNFEWAEGFSPHFGLIKVNFKTFERIVKESGKMLGKISRSI